MWILPVLKNTKSLCIVHDAVLEAKMSEAATKVMVELLREYTEENTS